MERCVKTVSGLGKQRRERDPKFWERQARARAGPSEKFENFRLVRYPVVQGSNNNNDNKLTYVPCVFKQ